MKKIFLYGLLFFTASLGLTSCSKDQHTDTRVTNYIVLTINGDEVVYVNAGDTYVNPVDTKVIGPYTVTYKATNEDGFSSSANRYVYVGEPLVGTVSPGSYRQNSAGTITKWSGYDIDMLTDGNGKYWVEDLLGGYYEQRAGYGSAYSMKGFLQVNADNTVDLVGGGDVAGWGDHYDDFKDGKYDPATKTISYDVVYAGMDFNVILTLN